MSVGGWSVVHAASPDRQHHSAFATDLPWNCLLDARRHRLHLCLQALLLRQQMALPGGGVVGWGDGWGREVEGCSAWDQLQCDL